MKNKQNIFEELNKMKNLMHAKAGTVISEQAGDITADIEAIKKEMSKGALVNSDEQKVVDIFKKYAKDKATLKSFLDQYKTSTGTVLTDVLPKVFQSGKDKAEIANLNSVLSNIGVTFEVGLNPERTKFVASFKGLDTPSAPVTNPDDAWKTTYSCVTTQPGAKAVKTNNAGTAYLIGQIYYYSNGRKKLADGTMANYTCAEFQSGNSRGGSGSRQSGPSVNTRFADSAKSLGVEGGKMDLQTLQTILKSLEGETTAAGTPTQGTPTQGTPDIAQLTAALNQLQA